MTTPNRTALEACPFRKFFTEMWSAYCAGEINDLDDADLVRHHAQQFGLVREEKFETEKHGHMVEDRWDFEEGHPIFISNEVKCRSITAPADGDAERAKEALDRLVDKIPVKKGEIQKLGDVMLRDYLTVVNALHSTRKPPAPAPERVTVEELWESLRLHGNYRSWLRKQAKRYPHGLIIILPSADGGRV